MQAIEERVQKIIANSGFCSRRAAEELISKGKVRVNGKVIKLGDKASEDDDIMVNTVSIEKQRPIYIMLNKPKGYEVTMSETVHKNVLKLVPITVRVFPVGRLDKNTSGLLLLTNDGNFANKIMHPRYEKEKKYFVRVDKPIERTDMQGIIEGIHLKDGYVDGKVKQLSKDSLEITIHEGRKWIIKRLFFKLGYYVTDLSRMSIGNLKCDVKTGKWRYLRPQEVIELLK